MHQKLVRSEHDTKKQVRMLKIRNAERGYPNITDREEFNYTIRIQVYQLTNVFWQSPYDKSACSLHVLQAEISDISLRKTCLQLPLHV